MKIRLSYKMSIILIFFLIAFATFLYSFSEENSKTINELLAKNNEITTNASGQRVEHVLNYNAEEYLKEAAKEAAKDVGTYIEEIREEIYIALKIEKTPESFLKFSSNRRATVHRRNDTAPIDGISFPFEKDVNDVEKVPRFKSIIYIDENGMEKIKIQNDKIELKLENVSEADYFQESKNLKEEEIHVIKKKYKIWDCTERQSTLIGESLYNSQDCNDTKFMILNITNWKRFTDGYIRYSIPSYENHTFKGIIVVDVDFLPIMKIINDLRIGKTGYAFLEQSINGTKEHEEGEGITIAHPSHQFVLKTDPTSLYKISEELYDLRTMTQRQHKGEFGIGRYVFRNVDKYTSYASYNEDGVIWSIGITNPVEEFTLPAKELKNEIEEISNQSNEKISLLIKSYISSLFMLTTFLVIVLIIALGFMMHSLVLVPVNKMKIITEKVSNGNLNLKLDIKSKDEFGDLSDAFNQMIKDLRESKVKIEKHSKELEEKVNLRTKDLNKKVAELTKTKSAMLNIMEDLDRTNKDLIDTQENLRKSFKELKKLDLEKDRFISIAAHELKTPMTAIRGFAQLLENEKVIKNSKTRAKYLKIIEEEIKRLNRMVTEVLDLSRMDLGTMKFNIEEIELISFMEEIKNEMIERAKEKGLRLEFNLEYSLKIKTDKEKLKEVFINLIDNAIKYTEKGSITVGMQRDGKHIKFSVSDTGLGIPKESFNKIFKRFYQVASPLTRKVCGTGLGLSICKELVEKLGGRIWFKSNVGKGTTFYFILPLDFKLKKSI